MTQTTIRTFTGRTVDLAAFLPSDVNIYDIIHALSRICRFNGHCRRFYSVAQHSCRVATKLPESLQMEGLLHDAAEAYIGDITRPLKNLLRDVAGDALKKIETDIERAIALHFGLMYPWPEAVHVADREVLRIEQACFWPDLATDNVLGHRLKLSDVHPLDMIDPLPPERAEETFFQVFHERNSARVRKSAVPKQPAAGTHPEP